MLGELEGDRSTFTGTFIRFGDMRGWKGKRKQKTILVENICDESGIMLTDHVWLNSNKVLELLNLRCGDTLQFSALVGDYWKAADSGASNSAGWVPDYGLYRLGGMRVVSRAAWEMSNAVSA